MIRAAEEVVRSAREAPAVGRLAPSPTGLLHLGHARTFLVAWWKARSLDGRILLRIEDLDGPRAQPAMIDAARRDLEWLGLDWDGPDTIQSKGQEAMTLAVARLVAEGRAYACVCSRSDVRQAQSAPQQGVDEVPYPGTCRDRFASVRDAEARTGRPAGIRFRVPSGRVRFDDTLHGECEFDVSLEVGDFLIARRTGAPAYQLAVVVDDAAQGVTDVVRGDDLLPSTARQYLLQEALGLPHPRWTHVPLVLDETGKRLAKRTDALSLAELRSRGADPRCLVGWAARTCGIEVTERVTAAEIMSQFRLEAVPRQPVIVTPQTVEQLLG